MVLMQVKLPSLKRLNYQTIAGLFYAENLVKQLDKKHYEFTDGTGTITVEISQKRFNGVNVTPKDKIEIRGEVDKDWNSKEIDVKQLQIIK
ncbi:Uncharacterized conserved protein [Providencia alcalifaciens]|nr:Uncharacterized conserved protein [Providencia alcalifaciens]